MQEVKNFSSGVLSGGGSIQKIQEREARRERERLEKEAKELEEKRLAEVVEKRNRQREQRALEIAEQARVRQAAEEERHRRENEKDARQEEQRLKVAAEREAARVERQKDLERRLAEKKEQALAKQAADEAAALLAKQAAAQKKALEEEARKQRELERKAAQEAMRKTQTIALLDELSKEPKALEAPKTTTPQKEAQEAEGLEEPVLTVVKGEVHVPAAIPTMDPTPEPQSAHDLSELMPVPAVLITDMQSDQPVEQESAMDLMERLTKTPEKKDDSQEAKSPRSENRFQKIINANRELSRENEILKEKIEKLLDEVHHYKIEDELVDKITSQSDHAKKQIAKVVPKITLEDHLQPEPFSIVNEAKREMFKYLSTRQNEVDYFHKSALFLKYIQDPFYMNIFVQNNQVSQWWPVIDSIYNSIELPTPDWSKVKTSVYQPKMAPQPIRARTATLGAPVASSDQPMDRITQHLGNMGI